MNLVLLVGRIGAPPKRLDAAEKVVVLLRLATHRRPRAGDGAEFTDWHDVEVWGRLAETCLERLQVGAMVEVHGRLQTDRWREPEGGAWRSRTRVAAWAVEFLARGGSGATETARGSSTAEAESALPAWTPFEVPDDET